MEAQGGRTSDLSSNVATMSYALTGSNPQQKKLTRNQPSVKGSGMRIMPESQQRLKYRAEASHRARSVQWDEEKMPN